MNGFIAQTQSELQDRIRKTNNICETFRKSYSEYSSKSKQIALITLWGIVFALLVIAMLNSTVILNFFERENINRDLVLLRYSLLGVCIYVGLRILKKYLQIKRIAKIDNLVAQVKDIEVYLQNKLSNINSIATQLKERIFQKNNFELSPEKNVESKISNFTTLSSSYAKPDDNILSKIITVLHWLSGMFFVGVVLFITSPFMKKSMHEFSKFNEIGLIYGVLIAFFAFYLLAKFNSGFASHIHQNFMKTFGVLTLIGITGYTFCFFILKQSIINNTPITTYNSFPIYMPTLFFTFLPLLLSSISSSIICDKCRFNSEMLGVLYMLFTFIILLVSTFPSGCNRYEEALYNSTGSAIFLLNIPVSIAAFFIVIIGLFSKINIKIINYFVLGIGLLYGVIMIIQSWKWGATDIGGGLILLLIILGAIGGIWFSTAYNGGCLGGGVGGIIGSIAGPYVIITCIGIILFLLPSLLITLVFAKIFKQEYFRGWGFEQSS